MVNSVIGDIQWGSRGRCTKMAEAVLTCCDQWVGCVGQESVQGRGSVGRKGSPVAADFVVDSLRDHRCVRDTLLEVVMEVFTPDLRVDRAHWQYREKAVMSAEHVQGTPSVTPLLPPPTAKEPEGGRANMPSCQAAIERSPPGGEGGKPYEGAIDSAPLGLGGLAWGRPEADGRDAPVQVVQLGKMGLR